MAKGPGIIGLGLLFVAVMIYLRNTRRIHPVLQDPIQFGLFLCGVGVVVLTLAGTVWGQ